MDGIQPATGCSMSDDQRNIAVDPGLQQMLSETQAWNLMAIPFAQNNGDLNVYVANQNSSESVVDELELITGKRVTTVNVDEALIEEALVRFYRKAKGSKGTTFNLKSDSNLLEDLVKEAQSMKSSDIHLECYEDAARIRFRIDGHLIERFVVPITDYPALVNRIKIAANLDIAEKRLPQDGRIMIGGSEGVDIRVSILPTLHGEKAVLRLLSKDSAGVDIEKLGFKPDQLNDYLTGVRKPHGIVLISGPTGSGKTTTLYATLKVLNEESRNILTIEDPIEYTLEGINQVQIKESIGLDFTKALKTFLRQDPDVIMLGEIRDAETAKMAIRAALTGHLVLSTIHTNSAWGTLNRLADMGVPKYLIASTINLSIAQRLVRKLCSCKSSGVLDRSQLPESIHSENLPESHSTPLGCENCNYTGYSGRRAIYEIIPVNAELSEALRSEESLARELVAGSGFKSIGKQALDMVANQETSIEEVYTLILNEE